MNFFEHQDRARRSSTVLVAYFAIAVVLIVLAVNLAAWGIARIASPHFTYYEDAAPVLRGQREYPGRFTEDDPAWRRPELYAAVTVGVLIIILGGSLYKISMLSAGGSAVATSLGGKLVSPNTDDPDERMLMNVVEEMSIASGVPMPAVYVLDRERGINAFAAGWGTQDAVIGVTRGCIERLSRDELQGVIAHEFSHILNGDMRLNIRLIGFLHGILVIALIGYAMTRTLVYARGSSRGRGDRGGGQAIILIALAGAALVVIGYVGVFFGRLIQSAVSRQREFLADASAVQFTRNPQGIAGALKKIGGLVEGSHVVHHNAVEAAHLMFSSAFRHSWGGWFATHPPLAERIKRIDPLFDGKFIRGVRSMGAPPLPAAGASGFAQAPPPVPVRASSVVDRVGRLDTSSIVHATAWVRALPDEVIRAAHEPFGVRPLILALILSADAAVRQRQIQLVKSRDAAAHVELARLAPLVDQLGPAARLPILEMSLPALRALSPSQASMFRQMLGEVIQADQKVSPLEYAVARIVRRQLSDEKPVRQVRYYAIAAVADDVAALLAALAQAGESDPVKAQAAYQAGVTHADLPLPPMAPASLKSLDAALDRLAEASPGVKRRVIDAAAHTVAADGVIQITEAELLRAVSIALDCPLPPFVEAK